MSFVVVFNHAAVPPHPLFLFVPLLPPSIMFTLGQWLTVAVPPPSNQWQGLGLLIELGWKANSNVQQMVQGIPAFTQPRLPLRRTPLCQG